MGARPGWRAGRQFSDEGAIESAGVGKQGHSGAAGIPGDHWDKNDRSHYGEFILLHVPSHSSGIPAPLLGPGPHWECSQERGQPSGSRGSIPSRLLRLLLLLRSREPEVDCQVSASQGESL